MIQLFTICGVSCCHWTVHTRCCMVCTHACIAQAQKSLQGSSTHRSQIKNHKINMHTTPDIVMPAQSSPRCLLAWLSRHFSSQAAGVDSHCLGVFSDWRSRHTSSPVSGVASVRLRQCHTAYVGVTAYAKGSRETWTLCCCR